MTSAPAHRAPANAIAQAPAGPFRRNVQAPRPSRPRSRSPADWERIVPIRAGHTGWADAASWAACLGLPAPGPEFYAMRMKLLAFDALEAERLVEGKGRLGSAQVEHGEVQARLSDDGAHDEARD